MGARGATSKQVVQDATRGNRATPATHGYASRTRIIARGAAMMPGWGRQLPEQLGPSQRG